MPLQSPWSRIPLKWRWTLSLVIAAVCIVLLVIVVDHNNGNGEVPVSAQKLREENAQSAIVVGQEQAPYGLRVAAGASVTATLAAGVRRDLQHQIYEATIDGPLQHVHCVVHGGTLARTGYHCIAEVADVTYPFLAVYTPRAHHVWFCQKVYPPSPTENIPVSARCRA